MEIRKLSESTRKWLQAMKEYGASERPGRGKGTSSDVAVGDRVSESIKEMSQVTAAEEQKRAEKISRIADRIASGSYKPDYEALAARMLEETW
ncbi:flagellar biosynthesis anti-sigma factor FlgM [Thermodesulforhabdus norvegica]|uniref:Anti-sigma-28 factor, FlgM n=1 Tax=Thermodesulforhabdus norvegica TaxID=39841 RepID=A0A1I4UNJ8_9BACT|nr:flagellar biosynthesis anti-sigma factor FlgM [Thermodesulforhabdus norvegica]SFM90546.1 Anti-sigma-28 factor, FlgM [Thermodesulforhabdus norvegica]